MSGQTVKIRSSEGGEFDCYLVAPKSDAPKADGTMPAIVLASAVHGVDTDIRAIVDEFAGNGVIAAAPDLFWRTVPGPLSHDDTRTQQRSQPRLDKIKTGERDLVDMLAYLRTLPQFNGQAAAMGSCYGSQMLDYVGELDGVTVPVCIIWGDRDHRAPAEVLDAYRGIPSRMKNVELHIFPGILHGYMMRAAGSAFDAKTREFSVARANAILDGLRGGRAPLRQAS